MDRIEYLEEERKKIWTRITELEEDLEKRSSDFESEARGSAKKAVEYKNKAKEALEAATQALDEYRKIAEEHRPMGVEFKNTCNSSVLLHAKLQKASNDGDEMLAHITSVKSDLQNQVDELESVISEISKSKTLLQDCGKLNTAYAETGKKIDLIYKNTQEKVDKIDDAYLEIFGYEDDDPATGKSRTVQGLKDKLENSYKELSKKIEDSSTDILKTKDESVASIARVEKSWTDQMTGLKRKIESLLPDALTAGLSHAFSQKRQEELKEMHLTGRTFIIAITCLVFVSLIPFGISVNFIAQGQELQDVIGRLPRLVMAIFPLYIPILWVAYSSNRRINLSKRLIEEYTHKEVLSKTYEGLSRQISELPEGETSQELRTKLLFTILDISGENPGKLISDYNKSDHPMMDALDKSVQLTNAVEKLAKLPGFRKLATMMEKSADKLLAEQGEKAVRGLSTIDKKSD